MPKPIKSLMELKPFPTPEDAESEARILYAAVREDLEPGAPVAFCIFEAADEYRSMLYGDDRRTYAQIMLMADSEDLTIVKKVRIYPDEFTYP